jgi:hypothetical protein
LRNAIAKYKPPMAIKRLNTNGDGSDEYAVVKLANTTYTS